MVDLVKLAAFTNGAEGGCPAGVAIVDEFPSDAEMQATAKRANFTESAFAYAQGGSNFKRWRVRFFAPDMEITFGVAAAAALGSQLADRHGAGDYELALNNTDATLQVKDKNGQWESSITSARTWSRQMPSTTAVQFIAAFGLEKKDLADRYEPMVAFAGSQHLILWLKDQDTLKSAHWTVEPVRSLMKQADVTSIYLVAQGDGGGFFARDAFCAGGIIEPTGTGSAAAALGGLIRDLGKGKYNAQTGLDSYQIWQGDDLGEACRINIEFNATRGAPIKVWGTQRQIQDQQQQPAPAPRGGGNAAREPGPAPRAAGQPAAEAPAAVANNNPRPGANAPNAKPR